ncbi:MAG: hypothetical protein VKK59_06745 [Vampirovibrionales bacterium]|nr:hypothetical protein [Vampirovibrionales bacterium]
MSTPPHASDDIVTRRRQAGGLLNAVFDETLTPRQAINQWPTLPGQPEPDPSMAAAFKSLWHFEADEALQQNTVFYLDIQLDTLLLMATALSQGKALPEELLLHYAQSETMASLEKIDPQAPGATSPIEYGIQSFWRWLQRQWHDYKCHFKKRIAHIKQAWVRVWKPFRR